MGRSYSAVLFDVGGTLLDPHPSFPDRFTLVCQSLGVTLEVNKVKEIEKGLWRQILKPRSETPYSSSPEASKQFWIWFYKTFLSALGIENREDIAVELYNIFSSPNSYRLFPDVLPCLEELQNRGVAMGIVSNWERWLPALLDQCQVTGYFNTVVVSGEVGIEKPDKRIFELALDRLGVSPEDTIFVGDILEADILPSSQMGMTPVLIDRKGTYSDNPPCKRLTSLCQLTSILQNFE